MPATATTANASNTKTAAATLLTPRLVCRDAAGAIEFYRRAFGAQAMRVIRAPDGRVMHAALTVGGAMVFLGEEYVEFGSRLSDPYGHVWSVSTNVRKPTDVQIQRGAAAAARQMQPELECGKAVGQ